VDLRKEVEVLSRIKYLENVKIQMFKISHVSFVKLQKKYYIAIIISNRYEQIPVLYLAFSDQLNIKF